MSYKVAFNKPPNVRIVDMCIYIDKHIYEPNCSEEVKSLCYQYIYFIVYSLACKGRYFKDIRYYDEFALFAASKVYMRLVDHRQYNPGEREKKLEPIKSVLNYIKLTMLGMRVDYQKEAFKQVIDPEVDERFNADLASDNIRKAIKSRYNESLTKSIEDDLRELPNLIKFEIDRSPYRKKSIERHRLYISCLLSLISSFTLTNENLIKLQGKIDKNTSDPTILINRLYQQESNNYAITWKLDSCMKDYVEVICNKIKRKLAQSVIDTEKEYDININLMQADMLSSCYIENKGEFIDD